MPPSNPGSSGGRQWGLSTPVVPFSLFVLGSIIKTEQKEKGTLIVNGLLGNLLENTRIVWGVRGEFSAFRGAFLALGVPHFLVPMNRQEFVSPI